MDLLDNFVKIQFEDRLIRALVVHHMVTPDTLRQLRNI